MAHRFAGKATATKLPRTEWAARLDQALVVDESVCVGLLEANCLLDLDVAVAMGSYN